MRLVSSGVGMMMALLASGAGGGEIIFVDPVREKAQAQTKPTETTSRVERITERSVEEARARSGRETGLPLVLPEESDKAGESAREARAQLEGQPLPAAPLLLKAGPPPSDAGKARQAARSWVTPASKSDARCKTENTVGGIEGVAHGHTVIQSSTSGVSTLCK